MTDEPDEMPHIDLPERSPEGALPGLARHRKQIIDCFWINNNHDGVQHDGKALMALLSARDARIRAKALEEAEAIAGGELEDPFSGHAEIAARCILDNIKALPR
jgi:hypothetical protein